MRWSGQENHCKSASGTSVTFQNIMNGNERERIVGSGGAMDPFASIALATNPNTAPRRFSHHEQAGSRSGIDSDDNMERPAKRAKSEKLPSPLSRRSAVNTGMGLATSYSQSSNSRMLEAELLLNFAQEARFSVPPKIHPQADEQPIASELIASPTVSNGLTPPQPDQEKQQHEKLASPQKLYEHTRYDGLSGSRSLDEAYGEIEQKTCGQVLRGASQPISPRLQGTSAQQGSLISEQEMSDTLREQATVMSAVGSVLEDKFPYKHTIIGDQKEDGEHVLGESNETRAQEDAVNQVLPPSGTSPRCLEQSEAKSPLQPRPNDISINVAPNKTSGEEDSLSSSADDPSIAPMYDLAEPKAIDTDHATKTGDTAAPAVCACCGFTRNIVNGEVDTSSTSWISCDACKSWYHFACAGFKSEREVRSVDKYRCRKCKPTHGATTYVRKSSRAHSSIDYAGLHQGVIKTSDDTPEHHYIQPIKDGTISFLPETFARMRPELVTAEYFEQCNGWREPVVIPAAWNPQPRIGSTASRHPDSHSDQNSHRYGMVEDLPPEEWTFDGSEAHCAPDHGQDALDMVMPRGLTVRTVAELYGPDEKVEVIDVKSQNGEGKKWNMRRWTDYYESKGNKIVRNVISLEVSQSKLGRLIRRPQVVRDLDLQDSVWPADLQAKGEIPRVQFYCLMSVADCFTDFHIDFGGSSVFYHILKGKKTFFFIPPKEKHLKRYEEWCLSPAQNWTFLGDQTKECYRVDLSEGDTMLIPAGWIHAVWTPEDSLVIGGNFLTRLNYAMQLRISNIERATGVARKFRYPHFQKIHWYAAFRYLEEDPLPSNVKDLLESGGVFRRESPAHHCFNDWGENSRSGSENYHARYYSQGELEGLPELVRYLLRTAMIDMGSITDGITAETRSAVKRSIPRGHGEPLDVVKALAAWCAWKRGNETIPSWAYPDAVPEPDNAGKLSVAAQKKLDREAALQAPRRQSARMQSLQQPATSTDVEVKGDHEFANTAIDTVDGNRPETPNKRQMSDLNNGESIEMQTLSRSKRRRTMSGTGSSSHRKVACESCRKRRRACKHKDFNNGLPNIHTPSTEKTIVPPTLPLLDNVSASGLVNAVGGAEATRGHGDSGQSEVLARVDPNITMQQLTNTSPDMKALTDTDREQLNQDMDYLLKHPDEMASTPKMLDHLSGAGLLRLEHRIAGGPVNGLSVLSLNAPQGRGRTKACNDCRKSKVCIPRINLLYKYIADLWNSDGAYMTSMVTKILSKHVKLQCPGLPLHTNGGSSIATAMRSLQLRSYEDRPGHWPRIVLKISPAGRSLTLRSFSGHLSQT